MTLRSLATLVAPLVAAALFVLPVHAQAAPSEAPAPTTSTAPVVTDADPADLTALREQAAATVAADPSAANHRRAAQLAERAGDYDAAAASYKAELAALSPGDAEGRATVTKDLQRVRDRSRGAVADEGKSSHRGELDRAWAPPAPPTETKPPARVAPPGKSPTDDRIVRKWYFWVTLGAIAGAAAAVTAIAIKASRDDKPDALDRSGRLPLGASGLRF